MRTFQDRVDAGRQLAKVIIARNFPDPVVLALPRGGVPVAVEVAVALNAPVDLIMVRKLVLPSQPELAVGAVVNGNSPEIVVNESIAAHFGLSRDDILTLAEGQLPEIRRRRALYLAGRASVPLQGQTAILVDDGIATGATMLAALRAVRRQNPARIVLAVPVAAPDSLTSLAPEADDIICLSTPSAFVAVGSHYQDFAQVSDEEVTKLLRPS